MELAVEAVGGLQLAADSFRISDKCFARLIDSAMDGLLSKGGTSSIRGDPVMAQVDQGVVKQAYYGLVTLFVESTRLGVDIAVVQSFLEDCKFSAERAALVCKVYEENLDKLTTRLKRLTFHLPHIVDVDWRLDYWIKSNHLEKINQATYLIALTTENPLSDCGGGGQFCFAFLGSQKTGGSKAAEQVMFTCTVEQLQDLVGKLKDAVKCWEKKSEDS